MQNIVIYKPNIQRFFPQPIIIYNLKITKNLH
jgi:hypothetical protein